MGPLYAARAAPAIDADDGPLEIAKLASLQLLIIANPLQGQGALAGRFNMAPAWIPLALARTAELGGPPS